MIDPVSVLQTAVVGLLRADTAVAALARSRIYASVRDWQGPDPAVTLGPSDPQPFHRAELGGSSTFLQIDCWAQAGEDARNHMKQMRELKTAVSRALHMKSPVIAGWKLFSAITVRGGRDFEDPDGMTAHGVITIRADLAPL